MNSTEPGCKLMGSFLTDGFQYVPLKYKQSTLESSVSVIELWPAFQNSNIKNTFIKAIQELDSQKNKSSRACYKGVYKYQVTT